MNTQAILKRILLWSAILAGLVAVIGGIVGFAVAGTAGLLGAVVGTAVAALFGALTALSILLAIKVSGGDMFSGAFFGIVLGGWLVKFIAFIALIFVIRDAGWINPIAAFVSIVAAVVGSLIVDLVVIARSRQPIIEDDRPDESTLGRPASQR